MCVLTSSSYYRIVSNPFPWLSVSNGMAFLGMLHPNDIKVVFTLKATFRACLHVGEGPQVGEVTRLGGVTRLSI